MGGFSMEGVLYWRGPIWEESQWKIPEWEKSCMGGFLYGRSPVLEEFCICEALKGGVL